MTKPVYPNRLADLMDQAGINMPALAKLVGTTKQQIFKLRTGQRELTASWAQKIAPHLNVRWPDIIGDPEPEQQATAEAPDDRSPTPKQMADRFKAARQAAFGEPEELAVVMGVPGERIIAWESGREPIPEEFILRFCGMTGTPLGWFERLSLEGMPVEMAARLGYSASHLLTDLLENPPRKSGGRADRTGDA